jgi:hypothetical protein
MIEKIKQKFATIIMIMAIASPIALMSFAASASPITGTPPADPSDSNYGLDDMSEIDLGQNAGVRDVKNSIADVINIVLGFLGVIAVVIIIYAGFKWMTAGGNEDAVGESKKMIIQAIIGLVIIFLAWIIAGFVINQLATATGAGGSTTTD